MTPHQLSTISSPCSSSPLYNPRTTTHTGQPQRHGMGPISRIYLHFCPMGPCIPVYKTDTGLAF